MFEELKENLVGCIFTIFTPFDEDGQIDYGGLEKYLSTLYKQGARKFYAMAYNSRYSQLSDSEIYELNSFCIRFLKKIDKNNLVIVGDPIHCSTKTSIDFALHAHSEGADLISLIFREKYFGDEHVLTHFNEVANSTSLALLVHEMPFLSGFDGTQMHWPENLLRDLSKIDKIVALKEDAKDPETTIKALNLEPDIRVIIAGRKSYVRQFWQHGAKAYLNGISMVDARIGLAFEKAMLNDDFKTQNRIINELEAVFFDNSVTKFGWHRTNKALLEAAGFFKRFERLPLTSLTEEEMVQVNNDYHKIEQALRDFF